MRVLRAWPLLLGLSATLGPGAGYGFFLDAARDFEFRARAYTEGALATEHSEPQTVPSRAPFQLVSHRTFVSPELEGKLLPYLPFQYLAYFPAMVFLEMKTGPELAWGLAIELGWAVLFVVLARRLFRLGLRHYSAFGG